MLLKPTVDPVKAFLVDQGITPATNGNNLKDILDRNIPLEEVISLLSDSIRSGDNASRLRAIETALKLHKVVEPEEKLDIRPVVNITVVAAAQSTGNLMTILRPKEV